jgi:hypothetical protein
MLQVMTKLEDLKYAVLASAINDYSSYARCAVIEYHNAGEL